MPTQPRGLWPARRETDDDALSVARGVIHGLIAGLLMWALLIALFLA
jgi:hypothetical protein